MDLGKFKELIEKNKDIYNNLSFLEVIDRSYDEDIISRYLLYIFENQIDILSLLVEKVFNKPDFDIAEFDEAKAEYPIDYQKRIDLFFKGKDKTNQEFVIIIENKIYCGEHDDQCNCYYNFINQVFPGIKNKFFIYLKPSFNKRITESKEFKVVSYDDLLAVLDDFIGDKYVMDFSKTIKNKLVEKDMNDLEVLVLNNYEEVKNALNNSKKEMEGYFENLLKTNYGDQGYLYELSGFSYRIYKKDWWSGYLKDNESNQYYFYVEILWRNYDVNKIEVLGTIKAYRKDSNNSVIDEFKKSIEGNPIGNKNKYGYWVLNKRNDYFKSEYKILSNEWKHDFESWALPKINERLQLIEKSFDDFKDFKKYCQTLGDNNVS